MPRLRQVPRSETDNPVVIGCYDRIFPGRDPATDPGTETGTPGNWWTVFALVPDVLQHAIRGFALYQSPRRTLPADLRELAQTRVGWAVGSQFVFSQHSKACRGADIPDEKIEAIPGWQVCDLFDARERAVLAYADALALDHGRVSDDVFAALRRHLPDEQILELTYIASLYIQHAIMSRALRTEFDDRDESCVEIAAPEGFDAKVGLRIAGGAA